MENEPKVPVHVLVRHRVQQLHAQLIERSKQFKGLAPGTRTNNLRVEMKSQREDLEALRDIVKWANGGGSERVTQRSDELSALMTRWGAWQRVQLRGAEGSGDEFGALAGMRRALWSGRSAPHAVASAVQILSFAAGPNPTQLPATIRSSVEAAAPTFFDADGVACDRDAGRAAVNDALRVRILQSRIPAGVAAALDEGEARLRLTVEGGYTLSLGLDPHAAAAPNASSATTVGAPELAVSAASQRRWPWLVAEASPTVHAEQTPLSASEVEQLRLSVQRIVARAEAEEAWKRAEDPTALIETAPLARACAVLHERALRLRLFAYQQAAQELMPAYGLAVESTAASVSAAASSSAAPTTARVLESLTISFWQRTWAVMVRLVVEGGVNAEGGDDSDVPRTSYLEWAVVARTNPTGEVHGDGTTAVLPAGRGTRIALTAAPTLRALLDDAIGTLSAGRIAALATAVDASAGALAHVRRCENSSGGEGAVAEAADSHADAVWWQRAHHRFSKARATFEPRCATLVRGHRIELAVDLTTGGFRALLLVGPRYTASSSALRSQHTRSQLRHALAGIEQGLQHDIALRADSTLFTVTSSSKQPALTVFAAFAVGGSAGAAPRESAAVVSRSGGGVAAEQIWACDALRARTVAAIAALAPSIECAAFESAAAQWGGLRTRIAEGEVGKPTLIVPLLAARESTLGYELALRFSAASPDASVSVAEVAVAATLETVVHSSAARLPPLSLTSSIALNTERVGGEEEEVLDVFERILLEACASAQWKRHTDCCVWSGLVCRRDDANRLTFELSDSSAASTGVGGVAAAAAMPMQSRKRAREEDETTSDAAVRSVQCVLTLDDDDVEGEEGGGEGGAVEMETETEVEAENPPRAALAPMAWSVQLGGADAAVGGSGTMTFAADETVDGACTTN